MRYSSVRTLLVVLTCAACFPGLCSGKNGDPSEQPKTVSGQASSAGSLPTLPNRLFAPGKITLSTKIERDKMQPGYIDPTLSPDGEHIARLLPSGKDGKDMDFVVDSPSDPALVGDDALFASVEQMMAGGAPHLFSADSQHFAYVRVVDDSQSQQVVLDGKAAGTKYASVMCLTFSPDGKRLAFIAVTKEGAPNRPIVVLYGEDGNDRGAAKATTAEATSEPTGGSESRPTSGRASQPTSGPASELAIVAASEATFSPDSKHFAYICETDAARHTKRVVVDGVAGKEYALVESLCCTGDNRFAYVAGIAGQGKAKIEEFCVVLDGQEQKHYPQIAQNSLRVSPAGKLFYLVGYFGPEAAGARGPLRGPFFLVDDGSEGKKYLNIWHDSIYFDASGKLCYVAGVSAAKNDPALTAEVAVDPRGKPMPLAARAVVGGKESTSGLPVTPSGRVEPWHCITSPDGRGTVLGKEGGTLPRGITQNGFAHRLYKTIDLVCFSPEGKHVAYLARKDASSPELLVVDGIEFPIKLKGRAKVLRYVRQDSLVALVEDADQTVGHSGKAAWSKVRLTLAASDGDVVSPRRRAP